MTHLVRLILNPSNWMLNIVTYLSYIFNRVKVGGEWEIELPKLLKILEKTLPMQKIYYGSIYGIIPLWKNARYIIPPLEKGGRGDLRVFNGNNASI